MSFNEDVGAAARIATWLILPVVIRLSQRLSHACLSINLYTVKLRMAHYISYSLFDSVSTWITVVILELIHALTPDRFGERAAFIRSEPATFGCILVNHDNFANRSALSGDESFKFLPYQVAMVGYWPTMLMTGDGELGFDSGEGA